MDDRCNDLLLAAYDAHHARVYRLGLRYGAGRTEWAEDLTHDVFEALLRHLPELDKPEELGGWLYRVTANLALSRLLRERSIFGRVARALGAAPEREDPSPEILYEQKELAAEILGLLRRLPAKERVVLWMKLLDGRTQREVAEDLGVSESQVSRLLARAFARLRAAGWEADHA